MYNICVNFKAVILKGSVFDFFIAEAALAVLDPDPDPSIVRNADPCGFGS